MRSGRLLSLFCFVLGCFAVPPQLVDKKLWFVNETVLNVDYELAVFQMEFDQDLYFSPETFVCGEAEKPCPATDCIPCDWSSQQVICSFSSELSVCSFLSIEFFLGCRFLFSFFPPLCFSRGKLNVSNFYFLFPSLVPPPSSSPFKLNKLLILI